MTHVRAAARAVAAGEIARRQHEPRRVAVVTAPGPDGHMHCAVFDDDGNGRTTRAADGHYHSVVGCEIVPFAGHGHDLSARRCEHGHAGAGELA